MKGSTVLKEKRKATVFESYLALMILVIIAAGGAVAGYEAKIMLLLPACFDMILAWRCGYSWKESMDAIAKEVYSKVSIVILIIVIGMLSGAFMVSGTVPVLVAWMGGLIAPKYTLVLTFILVAILAVGIGSSFAAMGTLGVVMFNVATAQGLPAGAAAAACICGASMGQYLSPLGISVLCAAESNKISANRVIKDISLPTIISVIITAVFFVVIGTKYSVAVSDTASSLSAISAEIYTYFRSNVLILIPLLVAIILSALRLPSIPVLLFSTILAMLMGPLLHGFELKSCIDALANGFSCGSIFKNIEVSASFASLMNRGGISSMSNSVIFLVFALMNVGLMNKLGVFEVIQRTAFKKTNNPGRLTLSSAVFTWFLTAATTDVFPPIIIGSHILRKPFMEAGQDPDRVASVTLAGAQWIYNVVPWSHVAIINGTFYGVTLGSWVPFAVFFWLIPVIQVILSLVGIGNTRLPDGYVDSVEAVDG